MKCPRCVQRIHATADQCPHCGFSLSDLDREFGSSEVLLTKLYDRAGILKYRERRELSRLMARFESSFPQLFFSAYYEALEPVTNIRQYGFWLLNRGAFNDVDITRANEGGIMFLVDVAGKSATISFGYQLDDLLTSSESFEILSAAHPFLLQGQYMKATKLVLKRLIKLLKKQSSISSRKILEDEKSQNRDKVKAASLQRIRTRPTERGKL